MFWSIGQGIGRRLRKSSCFLKSTWGQQYLLKAIQFELFSGYVFEISSKRMSRWRLNTPSPGYNFYIHLFQRRQLLFFKKNVWSLLKNFQSHPILLNYITCTHPTGTKQSCSQGLFLKQISPWDSRGVYNEKVILQFSCWEKFSPGHPEETKKLWLHPVSHFISTSMSQSDTQANEIIHWAGVIPGGRITFVALPPFPFAMHWSACIIISSCLMERRYIIYFSARLIYAHLPF